MIYVYVTAQIRRECYTKRWNNDRNKFRTARLGTDRKFYPHLTLDGCSSWADCWLQRWHAVAAAAGATVAKKPAIDRGGACSVVVRQRALLVRTGQMPIQLFAFRCSLRARRCRLIWTERDRWRFRMLSLLVN